MTQELQTPADRKRDVAHVVDLPPGRASSSQGGTWALKTQLFSALNIVRSPLMRASRSKLQAHLIAAKPGRHLDVPDALLGAVQTHAMRTAGCEDLLRAFMCAIPKVRHLLNKAALARRLCCKLDFCTTLGEAALHIISITLVSCRIAESLLRAMSI